MSEGQRGGRAPTAAGGEDAAATLAASDDATIAVPGGSAKARTPDTVLARLQAGPGPVTDLPPLPAEAYQVGPEVARGGMGRVVRAIDQRLERVVALKLLLGDGPDVRARFAREARITAGLQHPSIVPIYEAGTWPDGNLAYAMKLVSGESLEAAIAASTSLADRLALLPRFIDVVDAVAYAHSERVVHRDVKPSNIILGEFGETILIDWGVAKSLDVEEEEAAASAGLPVDSEASRLTAFGQVVGTPVYMPPEQAAGESIDERADVYALGAVLYQLLAGRLPYTGATPLEVLRKVALGPPPPLESIDPHIPAELAAVVARAMARERARRYSAADLAAELRRFTTGKLVAAYHYSARERFVRWLRRHQAPVAVAGAALAILAVVAAVSARRIVRERDRARESHRISRALVADQYAEQGRVLLNSGDRLRALAYLLAAGEAGARGPALDFMLARAARAVEQKRHDLVGHLGPVSFVAFDPSGDRVITAGDDGSARIWDPATGRLSKVLAGHAGEVNGSELAPGRDELVTFGEDGTARIWDPATGGELGVLEGSGSPLKAARYSGDGALIATAEEDGVVRLFEAASRRELASFRAHDGVARDVRFDPDGRIWTCGDDGAVALWRRGGEPLRRWDLGRGAAMGIAMSGSRIAVLLAGGLVAVWSGTGDEPRLFDLGEDLSASMRTSRTALFVDGGRRLLVPVNRTVQVIDPSAWRRLFSLTGHAGVVTSVAASADGQRLATASADGAARLWSAQDGRLLSILQSVDHVQMVAFSPKGDRVATAGFAGGVIWAPSDDPPSRQLLGHRLAVLSARFDRTGARVVTAGEDATIRVWDPASGRQLALAHGGVPVLHAAFDPSGRRVVAGDMSGVVAIHQADTLTREATLEPPARAPIIAVTFAPGGDLIAAASDDGTARVWNARTRALAATLVHDSAVNAVDIDRSGAHLVTATQGGTARVWDLGTGRSLFDIQLDGPGITAAFSPDGERIIVAARRAARIVDARSGRLIASLEGHQREVGAARLATGALAVTGGYDRWIKVWDSLSGRELASLEGHAGSISAVDADPGVHRIVSADFGGGVIVWDLPHDRRTARELAVALGPRLPFAVRSDGRLVPRALH